jgi:hypothetical protein
MMRDDEELRSRFDALRRGDEGATPELSALLARPGVRARRPGVLTAVLAAAATILVVVGLRFATQPEYLANADTDARTGAPSILTWQSPTASLLQTPGRELLHSVPTVRSSLLNSTPLD